MEQKFTFPTEVIDLPSKGLLYPESSPLSKGTVEMKYMSAKEEDILTNQNYLEKGTVIDKLLQSLIVDESINYSDLLIGDKDALMMAARILGYGKEYDFQYQGEKVTVDLSTLKHKELDKALIKEKGKNEFEFMLPSTGTEVIFKFLSHADEQKIDQEVQGMKKINKNFAGELTTRLKHTIISVGGSRETKEIRNFVENQLLAVDSRALRNYIDSIQPGINLRFYPENGPNGGVTLPIGITFFWPDFRV
jgi:hypothetical protein